MPICDICCEELASDSDMRSHLLLSHLENEMSCPFCLLSGVTYDELNFHIGTEHQETDMDVQDTPVAGDGATGGRRGSSMDLTNPTASRTDISSFSNSGLTPTSPRHMFSPANGTATPSSGIALTQGQGATFRTQASPPMATTPKGIQKLLKQAPSIHTDKTQENTEGHRKSKQKHISSPKKGALYITDLMT